LPLPSTTTVPTPETLAVLKLVDGFAEEPDELVVVVGLEEPRHNRPAERPTRECLPPATLSWESHALDSLLGTGY